jgi:hypothetical protein
MAYGSHGYAGCGATGWCYFLVRCGGAAMAGNTSQPLTTEQAKARLREAADRASPSAWLQHHPWNALGLAVVGGFIMSRMRLPMAASVLTSQWLGSLVLGVVVRQLAGTGSTYKRVPRKQS